MNRLIVVSGSRQALSPKETRAVRQAVERFGGPDSEVGLCTLMHGGAKGVDLAGASYPYCRPLPMPAQWDRFQTSHSRNPAGPIRNGEMIKVARAMWECGWDVVVLCFPRPSSKGTRGMIGLARRAGLDIARAEQLDIDRGGHGSPMVTTRWSVHVHELEAGDE